MSEAPDDFRYYSKLIETLSPFVTEERKAKIEKILDNRDLSLSIGLEKLYDSGNINAVYRTAENFGVQNVHIVSSHQISKMNRTTQGAHHWIDVHTWDSTQEMLKSLKQQGYRIIVTALNDKAESIESFQWGKKDIIFLGREISGCSEELQSSADKLLYIPTVGFTQSLNVSVAGAVCISHWYFQKSSKVGYKNQFPTYDRLRIKAQFYEHSAPPKMVQVLKKTIS